MKKKQFIHILRKYKEGRASEQERAFIDSYYDLFEMQPVMDDWLNNESREEMREQILNDVWHKVQTAENVHDRKMPGVLPWMTMTKIAAAVLLLIATGLLVYYGFERKAPDKKLTVAEALQSHHGNIHPGGHHAILTLANGTQVILDSMQNGTMAQQGNIQIIKLNNGRLAYKGAAMNAKSQTQTLYNTITTPRGGEYQVMLPDGSKVWLNAQSSLHFPVNFSGTTRSVDVSGEAYFEIEQQPQRPFIVYADGIKIEVLGTHFNVNAYRDEAKIQTTLTEGAVKISKGGVSRTLHPGEQAEMDRQTGDIRVEKADVDQVLAWEKGLFYFNNTNIKTIMREVSRWYNVQVVYENKNTDHDNFSGIVSRYSNVEALLKRLELTGTVHFKVEGMVITVTE